MSYWKYEIVHDYNATQLIKEFREENLKLKNSKGTEDDETDFIMYAEKDDHTISLGRVLLIKMSDVMVKYYHQYKVQYPNFDLPNYWAKYIYDENKNNPTFQFNESEIEDAFLESIKLQTSLVKDVSALDIENFLKSATLKISDFLREQSKYKREEWDPTLKSKDYLFKNPEVAINYFVAKCDTLTAKLKEYRNDLEPFKSFEVLGFKSKIQFIEDIIKGIDERIKSIEKLKKWLVENRDEVKLKIPFICGIWNGTMEFLMGFVDVILLAFNVVATDFISDQQESDTNLDTMEIREGLEEVLGKFLRDPIKFVEDIINSIEKYKYARYDDPKLNPYQIQYNEGEDTILAIDVIVTIVTIIKGIAKLAKSLSKFVEWIEEVLARGGKGARKILNTLWKIRKVAYGGSELSKLAIEFRKMLPKPRHSGNVAVFEYIDEVGKIKRKEFTILINSDDHAELRGMKWLRENNIADEKVVKIYSELEPCSLEKHNCKQKLQRYKNAEIEYSYDYPGDKNLGAQIRRNSIKKRKNDLKKFIK